MTDAELLASALAASGLSVRKFAARIGRNGRTVFAWKAKGPALALPASVRAQLVGISDPGPYPGGIIDQRAQRSAARRNG